MSIYDQEMMIGCIKEVNEEIDGDVCLVMFYLSCVDFKEDGKGLKIVCQSLLYGIVSGIYGFYFCVYCVCLYNIEQQFLSMFGDIDGKCDVMLCFIKLVIGGYYFVLLLDCLLVL